MSESESTLIGFAADLHVGTPPFGLPSLAGDPGVALGLLVEDAIRRGLARLVLGGDLVDRPTLGPQELAPLWASLARLDAAGVAVDYLLGQHDGRRDWPMVVALADRPGIRHVGHGRAVDLQVHDSLDFEVPIPALPWFLREVLHPVMVDAVPIRPLRLDGTPVDRDGGPTPPRTYRFGLDRTIHFAWNVDPTEEQCVAAGLDPALVPNLARPPAPASPAAA